MSELDGVRGIAIGLVLLFHNFGIPGGWIGVDLFFVLSGFLITRILLGQRGAPDYYRSFFVRRALRIFPPYFLLLAVLSLVVPEVRDRVWWYAAYLADFTYLRPDMEVGALHHTWSLAVEEQFYLVWPFVVAGVTRRRLPMVCALLLALPVSLRLWGLSQGYPVGFLNFTLMCRADGLLVGALLATAERGGAPELQARLGRIAPWVLGACLSLLGVLAGLGKASVSQQPTVVMMSVGLVSVSLGGAALVWIGFSAGGSSSSSAARLVLNWSPLRYLGQISYGVYLYHQPVLGWLKPLLGELTSNRIVVGLGVTAASLLVAVVSYVTLEKPILRQKGRLAPRRSHGNSAARVESEP